MDYWGNFQKQPSWMSYLKRWGVSLKENSTKVKRVKPSVKEDTWCTQWQPCRVIVKWVVFDDNGKKGHKLNKYVLRTLIMRSEWRKWRVF